MSFQGNPNDSYLPINRTEIPTGLDYKTQGCRTALNYLTGKLDPEFSNTLSRECGDDPCGRKCVNEIIDLWTHIYNSGDRVLNQNALDLVTQLLATRYYRDNLPNSLNPNLITAIENVSLGDLNPFGGEMSEGSYIPYRTIEIDTLDPNLEVIELIAVNPEVIPAPGRFPPTTAPFVPPLFYDPLSSPLLRDLIERCCTFNNALNSVRPPGFPELNINSCDYLQQVEGIINTLIQQLADEGCNETPTLPICTQIQQVLQAYTALKRACDSLWQYWVDEFNPPTNPDGSVPPDSTTKRYNDTYKKLKEWWDTPPADRVPKCEGENVPVHPDDMREGRVPYLPPPEMSICDYTYCYALNGPLDEPIFGPFVIPFSEDWWKVYKTRRLLGKTLPILNPKFGRKFLEKYPNRLGVSCARGGVLLYDPAQNCEVTDPATGEPFIPSPNEPSRLENIAPPGTCNFPPHLWFWPDQNQDLTRRCLKVPIWSNPNGTASDPPVPYAYKCMCKEPSPIDGQQIWEEFDPYRHLTEPDNSQNPDGGSDLLPDWAPMGCKCAESPTDPNNVFNHCPTEPLQQRLLNLDTENNKKVCCEDVFKLCQELLERSSLKHLKTSLFYDFVDKCETPCSETCYNSIEKLWKHIYNEGNIIDRYAYNALTNAIARSNDNLCFGDDILSSQTDALKVATEEFKAPNKPIPTLPEAIDLLDSNIIDSINAIGYISTDIWNARAKRSIACDSLNKAEELYTQYNTVLPSGINSWPFNRRDQKIAGACGFNPPTVNGIELFTDFDDCINRITHPRAHIKILIDWIKCHRDASVNKNGIGGNVGRWNAILKQFEDLYKRGEGASVVYRRASDASLVEYTSAESAEDLSLPNNSTNSVLRYCSEVLRRRIKTLEYRLQIIKCLMEKCFDQFYYTDCGPGGPCQTPRVFDYYDDPTVIQGLLFELQNCLEKVIRLADKLGLGSDANLSSIIRRWMWVFGNKRRGGACQFCGYQKFIPDDWRGRTDNDYIPGESPCPDVSQGLDCLRKPFGSPLGDPDLTREEWSIILNTMFEQMLPVVIGNILKNPCQILELFKHGSNSRNNWSIPNDLYENAGGLSGITQCLQSNGIDTTPGSVDNPYGVLPNGMGSQVPPAPNGCIERLQSLCDNFNNHPSKIGEIMNCVYEKLRRLIECEFDWLKCNENGEVEYRDPEEIQNAINKFMRRAIIHCCGKVGVCCRRDCEEYCVPSGCPTVEDPDNPSTLEGDLISCAAIADFIMNSNGAPVPDCFVCVGTVKGKIDIDTGLFRSNSNSQDGGLPDPNVGGGGPTVGNDNICGEIIISTTNVQQM